jgi:hypothetical protein
MTGLASGLAGMGTPEPYPEKFRDCARDVLAMVEAFLLVHYGQGAADVSRGIENYRALIAFADLEGCLRVAVPMVAASWKLTSSARAQVNGTSEDEEVAALLAMFRDTLLEP